jgi:predicted RNA-binding protein (virulence factor B family)
MAMGVRLCKVGPVALEDLLGLTAKLRIERIVSSGARLALEGTETLLLPGPEVPEEAREGDTLEVFVHLDSEDRPVASTRRPYVELEEVAFLEVSQVTRFGAFVDWGLPKDLLVPFAEQTRQLQEGDREPIGLMRDRSGRLAGTMRIRELLASHGDFELDEWVEGEAWRKEPGLGVFVILERRFLGLLPASEHTALRRGEATSFRIANVLPDGKLELSLRGHVHEELEADAHEVLEALARPDAPVVSESASPEQIRAQFGLSKKAFKRAVGRLLKEGSVRVDPDGRVVAVRSPARLR